MTRDQIIAALREIVREARTPSCVVTTEERLHARFTPAELAAMEKDGRLRWHHRDD